MKKLSILLFVMLGNWMVLSAQCPNQAPAGYHVVQKKENLYRISLKYGVTLGQLSQWNDIGIEEVLPECITLRVAPPAATQLPPTPPQDNTTVDDFTPKSAPSSPSSSSIIYHDNSITYDGMVYYKQGKKHRVRPGEKMAGLAELYGFSERKFRELNAMTNGMEVTAGTILLTTDCSCAVINEDTYISPLFETSKGGTSSNPPHTTQPPATNHSPSLHSKTNPSSSYLSASEQSMIREINLLRQNPAGYVKWVHDYKRKRQNAGFPIKSSILNDLIQELESTPSLGTLIPSDCMHLAAKAHAADIKRMNKSTHKGSDGSYPWDRVKRYCPNYQDGNENLVAGVASTRDAIILLLLGEDVPNKGHRKNLLNPFWTHVAVHKIGTIDGLHHSWIQMFGQTRQHTSSTSPTTTVQPSLTPKGNSSTTPKPHTANTSFMGSKENMMLNEINLLRKDPTAYITYIEQYRYTQKQKGYPVPDATINELVQELKSTPKLSTLQPSACAYQVAKNHSLDMKAMGAAGHKGSDGSWPWERIRKACQQFQDGNENLVAGTDKPREAVILLLIDDKVSSRSHRRTLLNPYWTHAACHYQPRVGNLSHSWVQQFAQQ